jgi:hypothetical protein
MFSSPSYGPNTASPNPLSLRHQLIERRAYGETWFTWPNGCANLMCWWWSCDSYRCRLTYIKAEYPLWKSHDGSEV